MKELTKTPFITALLAKVAGDDVDVSKLHVYEVRATSTVALRGKKNTIFDRAKISPNTIAQLARAVNNDPVALMMDHDMRGTPYGKFFYGEAVPMDNGDTELRGYMYVDDSEQKILTKLDSSSIDEVSIQFSAERMLCSECGFDYKAAVESEDYMPIITRTCEEGHKIGKDGVHLNLIGVDEVIELSMVSRGAAKNSKIIAPSSAMLGKSAQRLAANGVDVLNYYCTASISDETGDKNVDMTEILTKLGVLTDDKIELSTKLSASEQKVATLEASVADKDAQIATLEAAASEAPAAATPEFSEAQVAALKGYVGKQFVALKALDGDAEASAETDLDEMLAFIDANDARLSALIPVDGVSAGADAGGEENKDEAEKNARLKATAGAYKSNRN